MFNTLRSLLSQSNVEGFGYTSLGNYRKPDVFIHPIPRNGLDAKVKFQLMRLAPFSGLFFEVRNQRMAGGLRER